MSCECEPSIKNSISLIDDHHVEFRREEYFFKSKIDDIYRFEHYNEWTYYLGNSYTIFYYECADSLVYESRTSGITTKKFGKKVNGEICETVTGLEEYEHSNCSEGPDNAFCYSSEIFRRGFTQDIPTLSYLSSDIENQTIILGIEFELIINVPTDSTYTLLPGKYWIGEAPPQDKLLEGMGFQQLYKYSVGGDDFTEGYLEVMKSGNEYTLSFDLTCLTGGKWTGYYVGEIE